MKSIESAQKGRVQGLFMLAAWLAIPELAAAQTSPSHSRFLKPKKKFLWVQSWSLMTRIQAV